MVGPDVNAEALSVGDSTAAQCGEGQQSNTQCNTFHVVSPRLVQSKAKTPELDRLFLACAAEQSTNGNIDCFFTMPSMFATSCDWFLGSDPTLSEFTATWPAGVLGIHPEN
jgi:hypothetical protein